MLKPIIGYALCLLIALCLSENKKEAIDKNWKPILCGIFFQVVIIFALTNLPIFVSAIEGIAKGIMKLKDATIEGTKFVFGYIGGAELPFELAGNGTPFVFAFQVLPTIILVGMLSAILTYLKVLPFLARVIGYFFKLVFKIKEPIGMVAAAKVFMGQLEAPLLIKNKLESLHKSDIFIILTLAFATTSASVMPIYASALEKVCANPMKHIIISSVVSVISVLIISIIMMPANQNDIELSIDKEDVRLPYGSFMEAMSKGLSDGFFVWWCIVGSLIGMVALIALLNHLCEFLPSWGEAPITLQRIFGLFMYPFAWFIGIENQDLTSVSQILGTKMALNETIAFFDLAKANISADSVIKTIYAINNFGNFACIGITVGGLSALAPGQKCIAKLAGKAFIAGFLAIGLSATLASIFLFYGIDL
ncbi:MAG: hypothetical protein LBI95_03335 [Holosporales bacterium]|jgi:CNT family concentrative nucleoside transporter|nr:hypothetical protein [Holosporales bacterium]